MVSEYYTKRLDTVHTKRCGRKIDNHVNLSNRVDVAKPTATSVNDDNSVATLIKANAEYMTPHLRWWKRPPRTTLKYRIY